MQSVDQRKINVSRIPISNMSTLHGRFCWMAAVILPPTQCAFCKKTAKDGGPEDLDAHLLQ